MPTNPEAKAEISKTLEKPSKGTPTGGGGGWQKARFETKSKRAMKSVLSTVCIGKLILIWYICLEFFKSFKLC
jgi:hypothetical protein